MLYRVVVSFGLFLGLSTFVFSHPFSTGPKNEADITRRELSTLYGDELLRRSPSNKPLPAIPLNIIALSIIARVAQLSLQASREVNRAGAQTFRDLGISDSTVGSSTLQAQLSANIQAANANPLQVSRLLLATFSGRQGQVVTITVQLETNRFEDWSEAALQAAGNNDQNAGQQAIASIINSAINRALDANVVTGEYVVPIDSAFLDSVSLDNPEQIVLARIHFSVQNSAPGSS